MARKALHCDLAQRARMTLPEAVALLLDYGVPMDTFCGAPVCAYCGTPAAQLRERGHAEACVWAALRDAARRGGAG